MKRSAIAAAAALLIAAPAFAATGDFQVGVTFNPAKLETPASAATEYSRISAQISERCAAEHTRTGMGRLFETYAADICTQRTLDRAVRQINHPVLTEVHTASRTRG